MADESAATLLRDVDALRRRARTDRWGYWLPLLLLGVLILAAPLVYRQVRYSLPLEQELGNATVQPGPNLHVPGTHLILSPMRLFMAEAQDIRNPTVIALYWLGVVLVGMGATVAWYRWRGRRVGVETSTRPFVLVGVVGLVFLLGIPELVWEAPIAFFGPIYTATTFWLSFTVCGLAAGGAALALRGPGAGRRPAWRIAVGVTGIVVASSAGYVVLVFASMERYAPLLLVALTLLALAAVERSRFVLVVTLLFTLAAAASNQFEFEYLVFDLHIPYPDLAQAVAFARVLPPAGVLVAGGIISAIGARKAAAG